MGDACGYDAQWQRDGMYEKDRPLFRQRSIPFVPLLAFMKSCDVLVIVSALGKSIARSGGLERANVRGNNLLLSFFGVPEPQRHLILMYVWVYW